MTHFPELAADYEIIGELGRGGSAIVYHARERELGREVAIKVVRSSDADDEAVERLAREARLVASLHHPNVVPLLAVRHLADGLALVMQHVEGRTLKRAIREAGPLPTALVEHVLRDIASALAYAHGRHIIHRDIKPENIYLDEECGRVLLSDFGIARSTESDSTLTLIGTALGTPAYMSPEQIDGIPLDGRTDLYSLGLVAYEMLTGQQPWSGCNLYTTIYKQKNEELPPVTGFRSDIPAELAGVLRSLLMKDRDERCESALRLLELLPQSFAMHEFAMVVPDLPLPAEEPDLPTIKIERALFESAPPPECEPQIAWNYDDVATLVSATDQPREDRATRPRLAAIATGVLILGASATMVAMMGRRPAREPVQQFVESTTPMMIPDSITPPVRTAVRNDSASLRSAVKPTPQPKPERAAAVREPAPAEPANIVRPDVALAAMDRVPVPRTDFSTVAISQPPARIATQVTDDVPRFIPRTVEPELKNRSAVQRKLLEYYPPLLRDQRVGGTVELWIRIDESGRVVRSQVKQSSGLDVLDKAAMSIASTMEFSPALNRDRPVSVWLQLPIVFKAQ